MEDDFKGLRLQTRICGKKVDVTLREMKNGMLVQFWKIPREWNEVDKLERYVYMYIYILFMNEIFFTHFTS